jgi:FecR-like protein
MKSDEIRTLEQMGQEVADELGSAIEPERTSAQRRAVQVLAGNIGHDRGRKRILLAAGATVAWGVLLYILLVMLMPSSMTFWVGDQTQAGTDGVWLQSPKETQLPVRFDDGTQVVLGENSTGQIVAGDRSRVRIVLSQGRIIARVAKNTGSSWTVEAGPYYVTVLGTDFDVSWVTAKQLLEVRVRSGMVEVKGPDLQPKGVHLQAGDHLRLTKDHERVAIQLNRKESTPIPATEPKRKAENAITRSPTDPDIVAAVRKQTSDLSKEPQPEPVQADKVASLENHRPETWQELYDLGRYAEAVKAAEQNNLEALLQRLDDAQLWQLADSARFASRGDVARKVLIALRKRFWGTRRAKIAAFILGRLAVEVDKKPREACRWFQIYLRESPDGDLTEEALGRCVSTCPKAGMHAEARGAARDYLDSFPEGVLREQAEEVLKGEGNR